MVIGIGKQIVLQVLAALPAREHINAVRADAEYNSIVRFDLRENIAEGTGLVVAAHRIGFGEGEDDHAFAAIIAEAHR